MSTGLSRPPRDGQGGAAALHFDAGFAQLVQHGVHVVGARAANGDFAVGGGGGDGKGGGFDAVGNDLVFRAVQTLDAGHGDGGAARAGDFRAHGVEEIGEVHDLRFAGGAFDDGHAFGQHGGHHDVGRAQDGRAGASAQKQIRALELLGAGVDVAAFDSNFRAQGLQALEMEVDGARADDAAARQGDHGLAQPAQQRARGCRWSRAFCGSIRSRPRL